MRYFLIWLGFPKWDAFLQRYYKTKAEHESVRTVLALKLWQEEKGAFPDTLEELVAGGYLDGLPMDPYSDGPLRYQRRDDDFILYSVGEDFHDDGGMVDAVYEWGRKDGVDWDNKSFRGDRVFWPVR